ncbi:GSCOCG00012364001-RA-CDS, partial [Cotesia congregata]
RVTKDGIPCTTVITDGTYLKRSYASGLYNSSSGAALVLDQYINKVLDVGVANKRCSQCKSGKKPYHLCWQNYGPHLASTRMESDMILELFQASVEKYNLIYKNIVTDGDSSVHQKLCDHNVYKTHGVEVERINCMNHMLRRLSTNLGKVEKSSQLKNEKNLQKATKEAGIRSSKAIREAARYIMSTNNAFKTKVKMIAEDLENMPFHAFGRHENCKPYYCDKKSATNHVPDLIKLNVWNTILGYFARCQSVPGDVLLNSSNNPAECANNIIATKVGGKRIDFCKLGGYSIRVAFAVIQYNSKAAMCDTLATWQKSIPERLVTLENKRKEKVEYNNRRYTEKGSQGRYCKKGNGTQDCYYGPQAGIAITPNEYQNLLARHREKLQQLQNDRVKLERETIDQAECEKWHTIRRLLLTASNFKNACKCRTDKTKKDNVKKILYPSRNSHNPAMVYGKNNEPNALDRLEEHEDIQIEPCGLFIDDKILGFGASPDGLVGDDGIVEIKCPYTLKDADPTEAVRKGTKWGNEHFKDKD